jgi:hypothetical protein
VMNRRSALRQAAESNGGKLRLAFGAGPDY